MRRQRGLAGVREDTMGDNVDPGPVDERQESSEQMRPVVTRREFMAGAGAGLAVGAVVAGGIAVATRSGTQTQPTNVVTAPGGPAVVAQQAPPISAPGQTQTQPTAQPAGQQAQTTLPLNMRTVDLNIDGVTRSVTVDVRESLWEAMVFHLNMS